MTPSFLPVRALLRLGLGASGVLMSFFPDDAARLDATATEAGVSRIYAGIHYRFDMVAGLALGSAVANKVLNADLNHPNGLP